ncbi:unknown [Prevotella sp. CAG:1185]|nr:unknown [Prevotella sp. CAG:1185]
MFNYTSTRFRLNITLMYLHDNLSYTKMIKYNLVYKTFVLKFKGMIIFIFHLL